MVNDSVSDFLTRIRNANLVRHETVKIPFTKLTWGLANVLFEENLIISITDLSIGAKPTFLISLKHQGADREPAIKNLIRVSRPGCRVYKNAKDLPRVLGGFGIAILSTSKGLMTNKKAKINNIGGEILCYVL